jgi:hypothetical protein
MMKAQFYAGQTGILTMRWGQPLQLSRRPGEFVVTSGRVWVTRTGDLDDHVLEAGQRVVVGGGESLIVEPWHPDERTAIA